MSSYSCVDGFPAVVRPRYLTRLLREELGFEGIGRRRLLRGEPY